MFLLEAELHGKMKHAEDLTVNLPLVLGNWKRIVPYRLIGKAASTAS